MNYRQRPDPPKEFENLSIRRNQQQKIDNWLNTSAAERGPRPFLPPRHEQIPQLMTALYQMFDGKCAYCETCLTVKDARLAFFRPLEKAYQQGRSSDESGYYFWLLWDWGNFHLACRTCRDNKGTKFPIASEKRADPGLYEAYRLKLLEKPFLLDPCLDNPAMHLEFKENGTVAAISERGKETITTLDLNRNELCAARATDLQEVQKFLNSDYDMTLLEVLKSRCQDDQPFVGMRRQILRRWLQIKFSSPDTLPEIKAALSEMAWRAFLDQLELWHQPPLLASDLLEEYVHILIHPDSNVHIARTRRTAALTQMGGIPSNVSTELAGLCQEVGVDSHNLKRGTVKAFTSSLIAEAQTQGCLNDVLAWLDTQKLRTGPGPVRNRWALLVGINRYVDPTFAHLRYCVNDVSALKELLERLNYTVVVLHDDVTQQHLIPTRNNIQAELAKLCQVVGEDDLLFVHFACHGVQANGQPLLITSDTREPMLAKTGLLLVELEQLMRSSKARRLILTLDACHVGIDIGRSQADYELFIRNVYELAEGFALIAGSTAQQVAYEWDEKQHGVFTYFLVEGLAGKAANDARLVTINGLKNFVLDELRRWNIKYGGVLQEPTARVDGIGDMILGDYRNIAHWSRNDFSTRIVREVFHR